MKKNLVLIFIFVISFLVRINKSSSYPSLLWDEAALGYNAYSILETGKDEYGKYFPLIFKSFGDYKPGFYVYLAIPFIKIFGLSILSVRLPSILIGSLTIILIYFLVYKLTSSKKLSLISALVLAFNPFNIHYSKMAWETNILTFILFLGSLLILQKKYFWSSILLSMGLYTYQSAKILVPFSIIISLLVLWLQTREFNRKKVLFSLITPIFILSLPLLSGMLFGPDSNRLKVASLFSYPRPDNEKNILINESGQVDYQFFHNQYLFFAKNFLTRYFNHFSTQFLFFEGDWQNPRHSSPYSGVLLYPSIIFITLGFFIIKKQYFYSWLFFFLWLIVTPIPSSLSRDIIQGTRSMSMSVPLVYFVSYGIFNFISLFKNKKIPSILLALFYLGSFLYYCDLYYSHTVKKNPFDYLFGYKEAVEYINSNSTAQTNVYMTDFYGQPYIYYLFFSKYPPAKYQAQAKLDTNGLDTGSVRKIDNIHFGSIDIKNQEFEPNSLVIISYDEAARLQLLSDKSLKPISIINNHSLFYVYQK